MSPFYKLADASTYRACEWDLAIDPAGRKHWVSFFKRHVETTFQIGSAAAIARGESPAFVQARIDACRVEYHRIFDNFAAHPADRGRVTILTLDNWRDACLRHHGFVDAYIDLKNRENEKALPLLAGVCRELDRLPQPEQFRAVIENVFAGNIFDMGAEATAKQFLAGGPDFFAVRNRLPKRPWHIDNFDILAERLLNQPAHRKAVVFIDNAGSDFLLGALPMIRWLARRGTRVILAANERPTLNDMTIHDINAWWPRIVAAEPSFTDLPIERCSTGTGEPLIDLSAVSDELNFAARDADLVILEGMGRGVESNLDVQLNCDCVNLAMLKDAAVASRIGGKLYDVVCRASFASSP